MQKSQTSPLLQSASGPLTRQEFSRFFRQKYLRLLQAAFRRDERRPDYADPRVIEEISAPYREFQAANSHSGLTLRDANPSTPRHVWMLWQQGWDQAPPLVQTCARSWQQHNPTWEIHLLDNANLHQFAPEYQNVLAPKATRTARANIARLSLLAEHGGVWADATLFCQQPLDLWIDRVMHTGFFMFSEPRPYRYSDIWFLASGAKSTLINAWLELVGAYWQHFSRPHHYYWMEYLFELLAARNPDIAKIWQDRTVLSALGPLTVQGLPFEPDAPKATFELIGTKIVPVHKLSHKWKFSGDLNNTPVGRLTGMKYL